MRRFAYTSGFFKNRIQQQHISHGRLIEKIDKPGLSQGVCFGVACVGAQAILTSKVPVFDEICNQLDKDTRAVYNPNVSELLKKISIYQRPALFGIPMLQDSCFAMNRFSLLSNRNTFKRARNLFNTAGAYSRVELDTYFKLIGDVVAGVDRSLAIILGNTAHALAVGYDQLAKRWYFIDSNRLPSQEVPLEELSSLVSCALADLDNIIISGNFFSLERDISKFYKALCRMLGNKEWHAIHELTEKKTHMRDINDSSLLDLAVSEKNDELVSTLRWIGM